MSWWVAGATLVSGVLNANAAGDAADTQAAAAKYGADVNKQIFDVQNKQQAAGRGAGYAGLNAIRSMLPGVYTKYDEQGNVVNNAFGTDYLTHQFTPEDFAAGIDPGYAFRLQQGQMANQRAANIGGGALSGNTLAGLQEYTQGQASQEYGNAFNRYQTQRGNIYNTLASIVGLGQTAQQQTNQAAQVYGANAANLASNAATAQASGTVGQANAYSNAIQGVGNQMYLSNLRNNQTTSYTPTTNYSSGANYDLTTGQNTGYQGLQLKT